MTRQAEMPEHLIFLSDGSADVLVHGRGRNRLQQDSLERCRDGPARHQRLAAHQPDYKLGKLL